MPAHRSGRAALLLVLLFALPLPPALADLMIAPTRVVFEKNQRTAQVDLINNGKESATYRISVVNRRMSETGEFIALESAGPGELFAGELLRFSPRQVVLAPGAGQLVRIMLRKPEGLAPGEYRSHLQFDRIPDAAGATSLAAQGAPAAPGELAVRLSMLAGLSIPVIVRHGDTSATASIAELAISAPGQPPALSAVLHRSGTSSVYGDLAATFTPHGGTAVVVGKAGGVAVYTPNPLRRMRLLLQPPAGVLLARGTLRLTYRERPAAGDKLLAEAAIELP
jgi:P pilus assembly chaperone PapD